MSEAFLNKTSDDLLGPPCVRDTRREIIPPGDDLIASDSAKGNSLGVTRFEPDRRTCGDVEALSVGSGAIEAQARVGFDEMIVGSNLWPLVSYRMYHVGRSYSPGLVDLRCL